MSKKNAYSKVFGGKTKYDIDVKKSKKSKNMDIFFNEKPKKKDKKKKKKSSNIEKTLEKMIKSEINENENPLNDFIIWDKIDDDGLKTFTDISERCNGLFVLEVSINEDEKALVPVTVTKDKKILHAETGERIEEVFVQYSTQGEVTETDMATTMDALSRAELIDTVYRINTTKLMENINLFDSIDDED